MSELLPGQPWHYYMNAFRTTLRENDRGAFAAVVQLALDGDHVIRDTDARLLIEGNALGRSYNAMAQSDMGLYLIRAGVKWDVPKWVDGGMAAMDVMLIPYDEGGLGLLDAETETAWFVGKTNRESASKGGTINKHLYAARHFLDSARELESIGMDDIAARYQRAGEAGFRKLALGDQGPMLEDYFVIDESGDAFLDSWVYYSLGNADADRPYFLRNEPLNAHYHTYDMRLIHQVSQRLNPEFDYTPFMAETVGGMTPFAAMLEVWDNKRDLGGPWVDTATPLGQFTALPTDRGGPPVPETVEWFEQFRSVPRFDGEDGDDRWRGGAEAETAMGWAGDDTLRGRAGDDRLRGGEGKDTLLGGRGDDSLHGGAGADVLIGMDGADDLIGGTGADVFAFLGSGPDRVRDFGPGDRLAIDDRMLGGAAAIELRPLDPETFGTRVLYDGQSGTLSVDVDGPGGLQPRVVAILSGSPAVTAEDILLF